MYTHIIAAVTNTCSIKAATINNESLAWQISLLRFLADERLANLLYSYIEIANW